MCPIILRTSLCLLVFSACKDNSNSLDTKVGQTAKPSESLNSQPADETVEPSSSLVYSQRMLDLFVGVAMEPLLATPGFANFRVEPRLPEGLELNSGTGIIQGTPTAASELGVYRISADRFGSTETTDVQLKVYGPLLQPDPPIPAKNFSATGSLEFRWTALEASLQGPRILEFQVEFAKIGGDKTVSVLKTQKTSAAQETFSVEDEGVYVARVQSKDALDRLSHFSEYSQPVLFDKTPPSEAQSLQATALSAGDEWALSFRWSGADDGAGSPPQNLVYEIIYDLGGQVGRSRSAPGATSLSLRVKTMNEPSYLGFKVVTWDEAGNQSPPAQAMTVPIMKNNLDPNN